MKIKAGTILLHTYHKSIKKINKYTEQKESGSPAPHSKTLCHNAMLLPENLSQMKRSIFEGQKRFDQKDLKFRREVCSLLPSPWAGTNQWSRSRSSRCLVPLRSKKIVRCNQFAAINMHGKKTKIARRKMKWVRKKKCKESWSSLQSKISNCMFFAR